jgi:hypothetical protein
MDVISAQLVLNLDAQTYHLRALWGITLYVYDVVSVRTLECELSYHLQLSQRLKRILESL